MITPTDIANPKRQSGYNFVSALGSTAETRRLGKIKWHARVSLSGAEQQATGLRFKWRGPARSTQVEAAQDYCDYINSGKSALRRTLRSAGHQRPATPKPSVPSDVEAARGVLRDHRAAQKGIQGYVYLIVQVEPGGALSYGKVGYSTNPAKRVAELQTGNPQLLRLHAMKKGTEADERALHDKYASDNVLQEWFRITKALLLEWDAVDIVKPAA